MCVTEVAFLLWPAIDGCDPVNNFTQVDGDTRVLHAVWTADPEVVRLDGASTAFRSRGRRDGADWSLDDLWKLASDLNDLHQEALAELARQIGAHSSARPE